MPWIEPVVLENQIARLVPLMPEHREPLIEAASDGRLWELWYANIPRPAEMASEIARRLQLQTQGSMVPFTVVETVGEKIVGQTTYMSIDHAVRRVEIGSTWYAVECRTV